MESTLGSTRHQVIEVDDSQMRLIAASAEVTVRELAEMIGGLAGTSIPVPRSEWTVGETGSHLAYAAIGWSIFARGLHYPHGDGTPQSFAEANEVGLMGFPERGGPQLAGHLLEGTKNFLAEVAVRPSDQPCFSPLGELSLGELTSYFLAHNLMHGCAVSVALGKDFLFRPEHLAQIWPFIRYAFQGHLVESAIFENLAVCVHFSVTDAFDFGVRFENGVVTIDPGNGLPADCHIEVDALHFFLVMIKMLTVREAVDLGRLTVSGPNPELAFKFTDFFFVP